MSGLSRTANLLFRTTRTSLTRPRGVNPVQYALSKDRQTVRAMASAFERSKPHVNIGKLNTSLSAMCFWLIDT